jgi:hypothetical protein
MSAFPTNPTMQDVLDTFYKFVSDNITALGVSQPMHGIIAVQDWPPVDLDLNGGLYLLHLTSTPVPEKSKPAQEYIEHFIQWNWAIQGGDIQPANVDSNRGSRWRTHMALQELIRQSHFPGFCLKRSIQGYDATAASGTFTPYSPTEMIYWTAPKCLAKYDKASGLIYGVATLQVSAYSVTNPLVNQ